MHYGMHILTPDYSWVDTKMPVTALNALPAWLSLSIGRTGLDSILAKTSTGLGFAANIMSGDVPIAARAMTIFWAVLLALYVFRWAKALYGYSGGLFSLTLFVFSPNVIAHSHLVTSDVAAACTMTLACFYFWRYSDSGSTRALFLTSFWTGIALISKYTAVFLFPIFGLIELIRYIANVRSRPLSDRRPGSSHLGLSLARAAVVLLFLPVLIINGVYLFYGSFMSLEQLAPYLGSVRNLLSEFHWLGFVRIPLPLPYLQSWDKMLFYMGNGLYQGNTYLFGHVRQGPFPGYYFFAFLFKEPLAFQIILVMALIHLARMRKEYDILGKELFVLVPATILTFYFFVLFRVQIGFRYFLVVLPYLHILCGSLVKNWTSVTPRIRVAIAVLLTYLAVSVLSYFPHYIPYFNELVWNRMNAYKILSDSNLDWGQAGWYLNQYVSQHPGVVVNPVAPTTGRIVVSARQLTGVWIDGVPFDKKISFPEKYAWLREHFHPVGHIAYAYLIFDVSELDLQRALAE